MTDSSNRIFLGFDQPALHAAVDVLVDALAVGDQWDMSAAAVVVPGGRAGRRLLELLVDRAEADQLLFTPPRIVTVGHLPELLYESALPVADAVACRLALAEALRELPDETLAALSARPPEPTDTPGWLALADQIEPLFDELNGACLGPADVAERGALLFDDVEANRWLALDQAWQAYRAILASHGLTDRHGARMAAIENQQAVWGGTIYLLTTVELPAVTRRLLEPFAARTTALIFSDQAMGDRFDALGGVIAEAWADATVALHDERLHLEADAAQQADRVLREVMIDEQGPADEVTIGVPDAQVVPFIEQQAALAGWPTRYAEGRKASQSSVCLLLELVAEYLDSRASRAFAGLLRHADVARHLRDLPGLDESVEDWLTFHDRYLTDHLQARYAGHWLGDDQRRERMKAVHDRVYELIGPLDAGRRPLEQWAQPMAEVLSAIYGDQPLHARGDAEVRRRKVLDAVMQTLTSLVELPAALSDAFEVTAGEAVRFVLRRIADQPMPPEPDAAAMELVGWLELPLDDAARMIVTGMNDHVVPEAVTAHPFLPNTLRTHLGLRDNAARYARDAYVLTAVMRSRANVPLIAGRRAPSGDPLMPSRLLFADEPAIVAERVRAFYAEDHTPRQPVVMRMLPAASNSVFNDARHWPPPPPLPVPDDQLPEVLPVTGFRFYLACPYRFYLQYVLGLRAMTDAAVELEPGQFGSVAHQVLEAFGRAAIAGQIDSADATGNRQFLTEQLDERFDVQFGRELRVVMQVQREMLRRRLEAFADWQAARSADGWRIVRVEMNIDHAVLDVDGRPFGVRGRIDRVDQHEDGRMAIFDYKTSDSGADPRTAHQKGRGDQKEWIDLQLPLYRHLAAAAGVMASAEAPVDLGYILLPKSTDAVGQVTAGWSADELADADEAARRIVRAIRESIFYPPNDITLPFDDFAAICGTDLRRDIVGTTEEEADA